MLREVKRSVINLDSRMKLILIIVFTSTQMLTTSNLIILWNYFLLFLLFTLSNKFKVACKTCSVAVFMVLLQWICNNQSGAIGTVGLICFFLVRLYIFYGIGLWFSKTTKVGDIISSLQSMKLPQGFIISVVVFFRYMPTVTREFWYINASMRLRDVGINIKNMLFHPIRTVEYAFVPLIIRSMTIADRLSESALTRGLDLNNKRSNYRNVKISVADISICTVLSTLVLGANSLV